MIFRFLEKNFFQNVPNHTSSRDSHKSSLCEVKSIDVQVSTGGEGRGVYGVYHLHLHLHLVPHHHTILHSLKYNITLFPPPALCSEFSSFALCVCRVLSSSSFPESWIFLSLCSRFLAAPWYIYGAQKNLFGNGRNLNGRKTQTSAALITPGRFPVAPVFLSNSEPVSELICQLTRPFSGVTHAHSQFQPIWSVLLKMAASCPMCWRLLERLCTLTYVFINSDVLRCHKLSRFSSLNDMHSLFFYFFSPPSHFFSFLFLYWGMKAPVRSLPSAF